VAADGTPRTSSRDAVGHDYVNLVASCIRGSDHGRPRTVTVNRPSSLPSRPGPSTLMGTGILRLGGCFAGAPVLRGRVDQRRIACTRDSDPRRRYVPLWGTYSHVSVTYTLTGDAERGAKRGCDSDADGRAADSGDQHFGRQHLGAIDQSGFFDVLSGNICFAVLRRSTRDSAPCRHRPVSRDTGALQTATVFTAVGHQRGRPTQRRKTTTVSVNRRRLPLHRVELLYCRKANLPLTPFCGGDRSVGVRVATTGRRPRPVRPQVGQRRLRASLTAITQHHVHAHRDTWNGRELTATRTWRSASLHAVGTAGTMPARFGAAWPCCQRQGVHRRRKHARSRTPVANTAHISILGGSSRLPAGDRVRAPTST